MNNKIQKFRSEQERNNEKITALKTRNDELDRKIVEEEGNEVRALLRSEGMSLEELIALVRTKPSGKKAGNTKRKAEVQEPEVLEPDDYPTQEQDDLAEQEPEDLMEDEDDEDY